MQWMQLSWKRFWKEEDGLGTLEILLIVAVLLIIAIAFRKWIMKWVKALFDSADAQVTNQTGTVGTDATSISPGTTP
ncbi:Flp1 family type IVb pilin [Paenibacillus sp. GD4]|jgi:Flp pilus assembly pilin Flp|uniref:Flp1 family type IVb pilin n=1 Tax=Paenibacillus sp. GD4 TaxID=3068890 RepID=UPI002796A3A6|nr:Flp1 family type IVb pilin [Paenibacillus sp. GD4]MDQ1909219.1 Flp1 family type IVb pilin [Paenibacillus sp. GD4]